MNILLTKCSSLQIFIKLYLKILSIFIICRNIEVQTSLTENHWLFYAAKLRHICLSVYSTRWITYGTDFICRKISRKINSSAYLLWIKVFNKQLLASVLRKVGSQGDHRGVLLACQDEKIGYNKIKNLSFWKFQKT